MFILRSGWCFWAIVAVVGACIAGCGHQTGPTAGVKTYPVTGTVTYQGKPLPEATVMFRSTDGQYTASGRTDLEGKYRLTTASPGDGAPAGEYRVAIIAIEAPPADEEEKPGPPPKSLIPTKYNQPETSGLTAVVAEKENVIDFNLTD
jgi:hypothetical protein